MRTDWHRVWGSGNGVVRRASPAARLLAGLMVLGVGLIAPVRQGGGALWTLVLTGLWIASCRPPARVLRAGLAFSGLFFLPVFLLTPWLPAWQGGAGWKEALEVPWALLVRGTCGVLVMGATVSVLAVGDLREALARLPVPALVTAILLQVVHQAGTLTAEIRRVADGMAIRRATAAGWGTLRVLRALPQVWLPRVAHRAERVGEAMLLRGYDGRFPGEPRRLAFRPADGLLFAAGAIGVGVALLLRLGAR